MTPRFHRCPETRGWRTAMRLFMVATVALALVPALASADAPDSYAGPVTASPGDGLLAGFRPIRDSEWPVASAASESALIRAVQETYAASDGPPASILTSRRGDRFVIDVERTGFRDDSVAGERLRGVFVPDAGGLRLYEAGAQYQCARGASAGRFIDQLCP